MGDTTYAQILAKTTPIGTEDFVTGFVADNSQAQFGRPVGITTLTDGSLLFSEDNNGVVYRVSYKK